MAAKIVLSTVVSVVCSGNVIEGEFRGDGVPARAGELLSSAYSAAKGTSHTAMAAEVLDLARRAGFDCVSVSIQYGATTYALAVLEETA